MTTELQRAMARYEEARIQYKRAVLASLGGESRGDAIRLAIQSFQRASADLERLRVSPPQPPQSNGRHEVAEAFPVWGFMRRLLRAS